MPQGCDATRNLVHTHVTVSMPKETPGFGQPPEAGKGSCLVQAVVRRIVDEWVKLPRETEGRRDATLFQSVVCPSSKG